MNKFEKTWYNINVRRYVQMQMPAFFKNRFNIYWLSVLHYPLHNLQREFRNFTIAQRNEAYGNSQILVMQERLNNMFDPIQKRIYIENYTLNNAVPMEFHFKVFTPEVLPVRNGTPEAVRKFVEQYILLDKFFDVETI